MILPMTSSWEDRKKPMPEIIKAAYNLDAAEVARLIGNGVSPNSVDFRDNLSLLHIGCMHGDDALVELILKREEEHGDIDFTIKSRFRPRLAWQYAANNNHLDLAALVHRAGLRKERRLRAGPSPT